MTETLPCVIAKGIMSKLISFAADEEEESLLSSWGLKDELKCLQETAEMVQALLFDASSNNKTQLESVGIWLKKLNTVAYDADAVLEELNYQTLRQKLEINLKVSDLFSPSKNPLLFRLKITNINKSLDDIYKEGTQIGLIRLQRVKSLEANVEHTEIWMTHPYLYGSRVWGRGADLLRMVDILCFSKNEKHLSVVAMVGMGGVGKTTLAQMVCNHDKVVRHFDEIIWITVSEDFDVTRLLNEMVQSLTGKNPHLSNVNKIVKNDLGGRLKGKRYLLVWNQDRDKWECLRKALLGIGTSRGCKIMVTTRIDNVVLMMRAYFCHSLNVLSGYESWTMFKQRALAKGGAMLTQNMMDIGLGILGRCDFLPLTVKALGGLMYFKKSETEWRSILSSQLWDLNYKTTILPALEICYEHLPSPLKHCFALCSIYLKDFDLEKSNLIQLWMALGLLRPPKNNDLSMERIGNNYFDILFLYSMLQDAKKDEYGSITTCKMHDFFMILRSINQIIIAQIWRLVI